MQQPDARKYQLFPRERQTPSAPPKGLDPEQAKAYALGQTQTQAQATQTQTQTQTTQTQTTDKPDQGRSSPSNGLRIRIKEHNLVRRRKVSVPELGPMTTVQEVAMDSPTIPGRPPIHERSISAPGNTSSPPQIPKQLMSPKSLAPLIIPSSASTVTNSPSQHGIISGLAHQLSLGRLRSGSTPNESICQRSARTDDSPLSRTPYTPVSSSTALTTPMSATTTTTTTTTTIAAAAAAAAMSATTIPSATLPSATSITTPLSAPVPDSCSLALSWETSTGGCTGAGASAGTCTTRAGSTAVDEATTKTDAECAQPPAGHRRGRSESGSIMERGRPRKRSNRRNASLSGEGGDELKRTKSMERKAYKAIPTGYKASDAINRMKTSELEALQKQAYSQASRFEVLRMEDVESLSRELRQLDDRTEYLRRTYSSLRAGRRNLHSRICQYLRSPRVARFSTDAMLKQEEALADLDASIDDWMNKLEQAEHRRSLVRQKLLEHVAAAVTLSTAGTAAAASESLHHVMGLRTPAMAMGGLGNISTPPRSPTKTSCSSSRNNSSSPSPRRAVGTGTGTGTGTAGMAQVPSTIIEQPQVEEDAELARRLTDTESIRIYADSDVYALLADVEDEISKMSAESQQAARKEMEAMGNDEQKQVCRAPSRGALRLSADMKEQQQQQQQEEEEVSFLSPPTPSTVGHPSPPRDRGTPTAEPIFLTSAVFQP
ncbi:hypothetical protein SODALDRAFT_270671 [Sodiomyces alkalinus F11]|uniref:Up-regulated during septation protein 1 domain-containing protein n=1 Tax=Sodiomyces alkalinus (strain CBS 110278 / VKM F-3762 / F11) TaxID=1314773 RepID=A0A3N2Q3S6_SODAK|nr:hypothetical protein SODALDRAFT_270671 [Sodiomyces alkalinus F11]ROT41366.1 hypothetical protein SODALDRAFT_270671 [Sodiomyces alkalinus F11]